MRNGADPCNCRYPGIAIDKADDGKITEKELRERTAVLDNNPRDNDLDQ